MKKKLVIIATALTLLSGSGLFFAQHLPSSARRQHAEGEMHVFDEAVRREGHAAFARPVARAQG